MFEMCLIMYGVILTQKLMFLLMSQCIIITCVKHFFNFKKKKSEILIKTSNFSKKNIFYVFDCMYEYF